jgi:hypothetical protein
MFDIKLSEDDLNEVETFRGLGELYVKVYFNTYAFGDVNC